MLLNCSAVSKGAETARIQTTPISPAQNCCKQARAGNITDHQRSMKGTFIGAMGVAGVLAFMPGRMMFEVALEPTLEDLFAGTGISAPAPLFSGDWQIPVITVSIVLLVTMSKPIYRFLVSKWN